MSIFHVLCEICHKQFKKITISHLKKHNITFSDYVSMFPDAPLVNDYSREISQKIGQRNKGKQSWCKGHKFSDEYRKRISDSHWSKKPKEETNEIRKKLSENGKKAFALINADGRAFRMLKGHHTEEHKEYMRQLMTGRKVTWNDKISKTHWSKKDNHDEVKEIIDRISKKQNNGFNKGYFISQKMNENMYYQSSYEKQRFEFLESNDNVKLFTKNHGIIISYTLNDKQLRYIPDVFIEYSDGRKILEEIKGYVKDIDKFNAKCNAANEYCRLNGFQYRVIFGNQLETL